jgi:phosphate/sulfate permease
MEFSLKIQVKFCVALGFGLWTLGNKAVYKVGNHTSNQQCHISVLIN